MRVLSAAQKSLRKRAEIREPAAPWYGE